MEGGGEQKECGVGKGCKGLLNGDSVKLALI